MFCGRYWRSTFLCTALLIADLTIVLGGLSIPVLSEMYWVWWDGLSWGLWNPPTHSLEALVLLWILRLATLGRFVLSFGLARLVMTFRSHRYTCAVERSRRMTQWMMILTAWRMLLLITQVFIFWLGYVQLVVYGPGTWSPRATWFWLGGMIKNGIIGPAPLTVISTTILDLACWVMVLYYRHRHEQWHKFNMDISNYFASSNIV